MMRTPATTLVRRTTALTPRCLAPLARLSSTQALSNPTLKNIEKRWEFMPLQEQAELWMSLRDRMKGNWHELTLHEKKAAYWIAFGPHGPRAVDPPGTQTRIFATVGAALVVSLALFIGIRSMARPPPESMSEEWQEASNEKLKEQRADPFTGVSSDGYKGRGMVQSPPKGN